VSLNKYSSQFETQLVLYTIHNMQNLQSTFNC